ncbi:MAG: hypothetical protein LBP76_14100 [Treponema sp.]|jgi:hypothetical protein|nr:hypothetical protein [Treponema sp.]
MTIEQTVEIPANYRLLLELPRSVPVGARAKIEINIPVAEETAQNGSEGVKPVNSFKGILKGRGITLERFREMQREDIEFEK